MVKFYITTPAYYPNNVPHLGHAYTTIITDALARWYRLSLGDKNVLFISGLDEHGEKIETTARDHKTQPQQFVDEMANKFEKTWQLLNISYNNFIRTSDKRHIKVVYDVYKKINASGDIYKGFYEDWYCVPCESFWTENQLTNNRCPDCNRDVKKLKEESYFFKLSKYQDKLLQLYKDNPNFISPASRKQEIINRIKEGLRDLSISRKHVKWGIPIPGDEEFTIYCWIDALSFYLSVLNYPQGYFKKFWPPDLQLMAKEILWFHAVILPALLMSAKIPLPKKIFAHGWLTVNGEKMSKSKGNFILPEEMVLKYGVDAFRYFLIREIPFGQDGDFSEDALKARLNNELNNGLGNLVSRVLTLAEKHFKEVKKTTLDKSLADHFNLQNIEQLINKLELHNALAEIWTFVHAVNRYINEKKPWECKGEVLQKQLYTLLETLRILSIILQPFIPSTAEKITQQLGIKPGTLKDCTFGKIATYKVKKGQNLFTKV